MRVILSAVLILVAISASAEWTANGTVLRNYDGDTVTVRFEIWPTIYAVDNVRVIGVDTPEIKGKCPQETMLALKAKLFTKNILEDGAMFVVKKKDKYGRLLALVDTEQGRLDKLLIDAGLGRKNNGEARLSWCGEETKAN